MRRLLRSSLALLVIAAVVLPTVAPALCRSSGDPCTTMEMKNMGAGAAWKSLDEAMPMTCVAPECGITHVAPVVLPDLSLAPFEDAGLLVPIPVTRAVLQDAPLTPPPIA